MTSLILSGMSSSPFVVLGPVFHVPVRASLALFYAVIWICVFANAGRGLFVATIARNLAQVSMSSLLVVGPIILLSGLWAPPEAMPAWLRLACRCLHSACGDFVGSSPDGSFASLQPLGIHGGVATVRERSAMLGWISAGTGKRSLWI